MSNTFAFRFGMARSVVSLDLNRYCLRLFTDERRMFVFVQFLSFKGFPTSAWELGCYALLKADSFTHRNRAREAGKRPETIVVKPCWT